MVALGYQIRSSTLLRQCSITSALYLIFRTPMTKQINTWQGNVWGTYILLDQPSLIVLNSEDVTDRWVQAMRFLVKDH